MALKKIQKITDKQIAERGVQKLADRPNLSGQYGASGLSAAQLKLWFDKLATLLAERINEIVDTISSKDAANYIRVCFDEYGIDSLGDLMQSFCDGSFAEKILKVDSPVGSIDSLKNVLACIAKDFEDSLKVFRKNIEDNFLPVSGGEIKNGILSFEYNDGYGGLLKPNGSKSTSTYFGGTKRLTNGLALHDADGNSITYTLEGVYYSDKNNVGCYFLFPQEIGQALFKEYTFATREWVQDLVKDLSAIKDIDIVDVLPTENISSTTLYLLRQVDGTCQEYLFVESKWELIGSTSIKIEIDPTLSVEGAAADAQAVGEALKVNKNLSIIATYNITEANTTISLRHFTDEIPPIIDWGDGSKTINGYNISPEGNLNHTYAETGEYKCRVYGITATPSNMFTNDVQLTKVVITDAITEIGDYTFCNAVSITDIVIPDSVSIIGEGAFGHCYNLKRLTIGSGVKELKQWFLPSTTPLEVLEINAIVPPKIVSIASPIKRIIVPAESLEAYKTAEGWSNYATLICCNITSDELSQYAKQELGDIETALDRIIEIQNSLVGGGA